MGNVLFKMIMAAAGASLVGSAAALGVGMVYLDHNAALLHPAGFFAVYLGVALPAYCMMWRAA